MNKRSLSDIRAVVAAALGLISIFLLLCAGLAHDPADLARSGGVNANLWSGLALLAIAAGMGLWWFLRPVQAPSPRDQGTKS
ncbi:hypothetical protein D4740_08825 [Actinomyces sp. 2119]|uniref:Uncharacterized protein n=1 Tax=Actinomyces lilanjuaniae TaxID=2321394 RepID=A0ABM6Z4G2_9ACTO|nr:MULTISPECIES: hypothetical protein [Actinomyces]AYD90221.1 hypothetical protein D5R93_09800 [Actinomyces lilanjuaniae]RJF41483.1 hypothetical protein D4740_08825 [Actinomyces sp. 2119]